MTAHQKQFHHSSGARRARRNASVSFELLERRALLAQASAFLGSGAMTNPTPTMMNPTPAMMSPTPAMMNPNTAMTTQFVQTVHGRVAGPAAFRAPRSLFLAPTRTRSSSMPAFPRVVAGPTLPTTVMVPTSPAAIRLPADAPKGPTALHGHHGPEHHQHTRLTGHHVRHRP